MILLGCGFNFMANCFLCHQSLWHTNNLIPWAQRTGSVQWNSSGRNMSLLLCPTKAGLSCVMKTVTMLTAIWGSNSGQLIQLGSTPNIKWFLNAFFTLFYISKLHWLGNKIWLKLTISFKSSSGIIKKVLEWKAGMTSDLQSAWGLRWPRGLCSRGVGWDPVNLELGSARGKQSLYKWPVKDSTGRPF